MGPSESGDPRTALVVVDYQRGFVGTADHEGTPGGGATVPAVRGWVEHARDHGWPVLWTRDVDPFPVPEGDPAGLLDLDGLRAELGHVGIVVDKGPGSRGGFSGFVLDHDGLGSGNLSALAPALVRERVQEVVVVGLAADVCVAATARDALRLGYGVRVPRAATAFAHLHPAGDQAALAELEAAGARVVG